ncbi:MAG: hypothetical protein RL407_1 [Bacteroidota bacterium]
MQEDNWSTRFGSRLRKHQEDSPPPYVTGAWEAFEEKRDRKRRSLTILWIGGMAAGVALVLTLGSLWLGDKGSQSSPDLLGSSTSKPEEAQPTVQENTPKQASENLANLPSGYNTEPQVTQAESSQSSQGAVGNVWVATKDEKPMMGSSVLSEGEEILPLMATVSPKDEKSQGNPSSAAQGTTTEKPRTDLVQELISLEENPIEELSSAKKPISYALGFGPGFGSTTQANQVTEGSRIGLGLQVDLALGNNLRLGSGLGVNYLNQATEGQASYKLAGVNSPIQENTQVQQVQVDVPVYLRYPLTRSETVSVQAGFSNLLTVNQTAEMEVRYTQEVVSPASAATANGNSPQPQVRTIQVAQTSPLPGASTRFLPFAMANLGFNIQVRKTESSSYMLMPFYSYPIQDISGTGKNPGVIGAALKVSLGLGKK